MHRDPVSRTERSRALFAMRVLASTAVVTRLLFPGSLTVDVWPLAVVTIWYLVGAVGLEAVRRAKDDGRLVTALALGFDGLYAAGMVQVTGSMDSPLRYLLMFHLLAVTLLMSFRTGVLVALWDFGVLLAAHRLADHGVAWLAAPGVSSPTPEVVLYAAACLLVLVCTASFADINERELRRRSSELGAITRLASDLAVTRTSAHVGAVTCAAIREAFPVARVLVFGHTEERDELVAAWDSDDLGWSGPMGQVGDLPAEVWQLHAPRLVRTGNPEEAGLLVPWRRYLLGGRPVLLLPMTADALPVGVVLVEFPDGHDGRAVRRAAELARQFAAQAALALLSSQLLHRVEQLAATDPLTGTANRRAFDAVLARELARADRTHETVSLLLIDLDHFKALNDEHGHLAGDEALRRVADELVGGVREMDLVARYGGEEFAIILPATETAPAGVLAERLRTAVRDLGGRQPLSFSAGLASYPHDALTAPELVAAADRALYAAKQSGRDQVRTAQGVRCDALPYPEEPARSSEPSRQDPRG